MSWSQGAPRILVRDLRWGVPWTHQGLKFFFYWHFEQAFPLTRWHSWPCITINIAIPSQYFTSIIRVFQCYWLLNNIWRVEKHMETIHPLMIRLHTIKTYLFWVLGRGKPKSLEFFYRPRQGQRRFNSLSAVSHSLFFVYGNSGRSAYFHILDLNFFRFPLWCPVQVIYWSRSEDGDLIGPFKLIISFGGMGITCLGI